ncbi:MAG: sigma-54-dependent transcriptional regulator [Phycisphaerae bacterium]
MGSDRLQRSLLIIDDEESICLAFRRFFDRREWNVRIASTAAEGRTSFRQSRPSAVFLDVRLPDGDGLELLRELMEIDPSVPVIMITAYGGLDTVMRSMEGRAFDYLPKPIDLARAEQMAERAWETWGQPSAATPRAEPRSEETIIGSSPAMQSVFKRVAVLSRSDCNVLLLGQTGTGKELIARAIHRHSNRAGKPFVAVNCGAIPENLVESQLFGHVRGAFTGAERDQVGKFEAADGGTLFLDEIGELPPAAQVKLLRVLDSQTVERVGSTESRRLDVRVLAATNRDLPADAEQGRFRADLYYRLAVVQVELPPLAERREDILPLAERFLVDAGHGPGVPQFTIPAARALRAYAWPGNVRELKNAMLHVQAVSPGGAVRREDLPESVRRADGESSAECAYPHGAVEYLTRLTLQPGSAHAQALEPVEREVIRLALARCEGNRSEAAEFLGLHRNTLRNRMRQLGLE